MLLFDYSSRNLRAILWELGFSKMGVELRIGFNIKIYFEVQSK